MALISAVNSTCRYFYHVQRLKFCSNHQCLYQTRQKPYSWQAIWGMMQYCNFCLGADSHLTAKSQTPAFKISVTHRLLFSFTGASSDLFVSRRALQLTPQCQMDSSTLIGAGGCESEPWPSVGSLEEASIRTHLLKMDIFQRLTSDNLVH